jgi:hypothetical protein
MIVVEGPGDDLAKLFDNVRAAAPTLKEIRVITSDAVGVADGGGSNRDEEKAGRRTSLREFARRFSLENTSERLAVIAYHAVKEAGKPTFSVKEMNDWFGLCGFKKPIQMPVALSDAKRKYGYLENKGRDQWTLATGGENLVLSLLESRAE